MPPKSQTTTHKNQNEHVTLDMPLCLLRSNIIFIIEKSILELHGPYTCWPLLHTEKTAKSDASIIKFINQFQLI